MMLDYFYNQVYLKSCFLNCFATKKIATDFKKHFMNILISVALVPLWSHSNKDKNQENLKNGIMRGLEITSQSNLLKIAFPPLADGVFGFSTDMCATIMLRTMRDFITKNSHLSLKIIRVVVDNIRQVKTFARIMMENNL